MFIGNDYQKTTLLIFLMNGTFRLREIQSNQSKCAEYLSKIPTNVSVRDAISEANSLCPELAIFTRENLDKFSGLRARDKGSMGKIAEFFLFGQLPNSFPSGSCLGGGH